MSRRTSWCASIGAGRPPSRIARQGAGEGCPRPVWLEVDSGTMAVGASRVWAGVSGSSISGEPGSLVTVLTGLAAPVIGIDAGLARDWPRDRQLLATPLRGCPRDSSATTALFE